MPVVVYVVLHSYEDERPGEHVKMIGVYSTRNLAEAAVERLRVQPGFKDYPLLVDPTSEQSDNGFHIDEYVVDCDYWTEGFVRIDALD
jgi:hypothetical protein